MALVTVMLVLMILLFLGTTLLSLAVTEQNISHNHVREVQAYYLAEAGLEQAVAILKADPAWREGISDQELGPGSIDSVTVTELGTQDGVTTLLLEAVGRAGGARQTLETQIQLSGDLFDNFPDGARVDAAGEDLKITGSPTINGSLYYSGDLEFSSGVLIGDLWVNGDLEVKGTVNGDAYATGSIITRSNGIITGSINAYTDVTIVPFPDIDLDRYQQEADYTYDSDQDFHGTLNLNGIYFVDGDVEIRGTYYGRATIVATGDIEIDGDLINGDPATSMLGLVAGDEIEVGSNDTVEAMLLAEDVEMSGGANLRGALVARKLDLDGNITITFDQETFTQLPAQLERVFMVNYWIEKYPVF